MTICPVMSLEKAKVVYFAGLPPLCRRQNGGQNTDKVGHSARA